MVKGHGVASRVAPQQQSLFSDDPTPPKLNVYTYASDQIEIFDRETLPVSPPAPPIPVIPRKRNCTPNPRSNQYHFGVVEITDKDRKRWRKETRLLRAKNRQYLEQAPPDEYLEWHEKSLRFSLKEIKEGRCGEAAREEILNWIFAPMARQLGQVVAFSFQACCLLAGLDPVKLRDKFINLINKEIYAES